ncbi:MAG: prepilin-type N-terminal cleavage/methylation domain-containing protein [Deltaproteobacteria bacterium]|nr:prepilin-type N-terminal cleavage/methylation domain-containing protein [Deltaproteobacteria bacterium]
MRTIWFDKNEGGFSLVELLIAMAILAIGLLALADMQIASIKGNSFSGATTDATTLAQDRLEQLMTLTYSGLTTDANLVDTDADGDAGLNDATAGTADFSQTQGNYTIFWNVSDGSVVSNTKTLSVIVTWSEQGQQKKVSVRGIKPRID